MKGSCGESVVNLCCIATGAHSEEVYVRRRVLLLLLLLRIVRRRSLSAARSSTEIPHHLGLFALVGMVVRKKGDCMECTAVANDDGVLIRQGLGASPA